MCVSPPPFGGRAAKPPLEILDRPAHADGAAVGTGGDVEIVDEPGEDGQTHLGVVKVLIVIAFGSTVNSAINSAVNSAINGTLDSVIDTAVGRRTRRCGRRSEEHTSELQSL